MVKLTQAEDNQYRKRVFRELCRVQNQDDEIIFKYHQYSQISNLADSNITRQNKYIAAKNLETCLTLIRMCNKVKGLGTVSKRVE